MYNSTMANFNTPEIMEARALYRAHMERQKAAVMEQLNPIVVDYYYVPEIFREVTEDEAYEMYWTARDAAREEERERDERATSIARELAYEFELEQQGLR